MIQCAHLPRPVRNLASRRSGGLACTLEIRGTRGSELIVEDRIRDVTCSLSATTATDPGISSTRRLLAGTW